jgi:hypothetical protein
MLHGGCPTLSTVFSYTFISFIYLSTVHVCVLSIWLLYICVNISPFDQVWYNANHVELNIRLPRAQDGVCLRGIGGLFSWASVGSYAPLCVSAEWLSI